MEDQEPTHVAAPPALDITTMRKRLSDMRAEIDKRISTRNKEIKTLRAQNKTDRAELDAIARMLRGPRRVKKKSERVLADKAANEAAALELGI